MSRPKRTPEEEILHLKRKLRKLEGHSGTPISITGEYRDREHVPSRTETFARRHSGDGIHLAAESRASLGGVEPHSPRDAPPVNSNVMEVNSTRVEPRANVNVTEPNSARDEPRSNVNITEPNSARAEPRSNVNITEPNSAQTEQANVITNEANIMSNIQEHLNSMEAHSSTSTPVRARASLNNARKKLHTNSETSQPDNSDTNHVLDRNEALLNALGDDLSLSGEVIHPSLAQKWNTILRKGLSMDIKEKLLKEYAAPENCKLLKAPTLNEEVLAVVEYHARNRDKIMENKQNQLGLGITAIGRAITVLLNQDANYEVNAMRHFNHGCRILLDLHYIETNSRRHLFKNDLIRSEVFRNLRILDLERDDTLFGNKVAKLVKKQGIIPSTNTRPSSSSYGDSVLSSHSRNETNREMYREGDSRFRRN